MGRKISATSGMNVAEKQSTPLAKRLSELIVDTNALKEYLSVSAQAINQYKLGLARPSLENLCKISEFYGVSTDYLLGLTDMPSVREDVKEVHKITGLSVSVIEWLHSISSDTMKTETLSAILGSKTFQAIIPFVVELKTVQIAAEMDRCMVEPFDITPTKEIGYGQYVVGGYEYLSVLEYKISEFFKMVIDEVTSPNFGETEG